MAADTLTPSEVIAILDRTIAHAERTADAAELELANLGPASVHTTAPGRYERALGRLHGLKEARELLERTEFDPDPEPEPPRSWPWVGTVDGATVLVGTRAEVDRWRANLPAAYAGRAAVRSLVRGQD